ncbi:MAG: prephenate dehydrogenase/arogenate dehydrogenase family protein [Acidobacteriota bacterium]
MSHGFKTVAIVGVGLIGGSFALAIRKAGFKGRIIGVSSPATIRKALELGVIDDSLPLADAASQADLIYLAQPIQQIIATLGSIDAHVRPGTLITDAGSTKAAISKAASVIKRGRFVGGHPMAGKESRGVEGADADLFRDCPYVLTAREPLFEAMIERIGARLVLLSAEEHDRLIALASHLPQMLSTALGSVLTDNPAALQVAGPGAVDMTRLALSSYDIWRDIIATNRESIDAALVACIERLQQVRAQLAEPAMEQAFARGAEAARALRKG